MKAVKHSVTHHFQPTNTTCSQTALSILLSHYEIKIGPLDIEEQVPQSLNEKGEKNGTINQQLATWCQQNGFDVSLYTFDCQVIDQSWASLDKNKLLKRLRLRKSGWVVPGMGELWTKEYTQSYIDFIEADGELIIQPCVTTKLLYELLDIGPILPCITYSTMYATGRSVLDQQTDRKDDINGRAGNHSIVIYGYDDNGNFLVADPERKPGMHVIEPERMLGAISTAQIECDNLLFQIRKKSES